MVGERALWLAMILIVAGALLRFHDLDEHGLWADELFSASTAWFDPAPDAPFFEVKSTPTVRFGDSFWTQMGADVHPPLFESILAPWMAIFGPSELSVRFPGFIASLLLMVALFVGLRRLVGTPAGLFALASAALNPALILYARDARQYNFLLLFSALAALTSLSYFRRYSTARSQSRLGWREVGPLILLALTHYYGIALAAVLASGYGLAALARRDWWGIGRLAVLLGVVLTWAVVNQGGLRWATSGINRWYDYAPTDFFRMLVPEAFSFSFPLWVGALYLAALVGFGILAYVGHVPSSRRPKILGPATLRPLPAHVVLGVVMAYALVLSLICAYAVRSGTFNPRYTLHTLVVLHIGGAIALASLPGRPALKLLGLSVLCTLGLVRSSTLQNPFYQEYREASRFIADRIGPGDAVVGAWAPNLKYYYYYLHQMIPDDQYELRGYSHHREIAEFCTELTAASASRRNEVFIFYPGARPSDLADHFAEECATSYQRVERRLFRGVGVDRFERLSTSS